MRSCTECSPSAKKRVNSDPTRLTHPGMPRLRRFSRIPFTTPRVRFVRSKALIRSRRISSRQVLAPHGFQRLGRSSDSRVTRAPSLPIREDSGIVRRPSPVTAAGPFPIHTGFPPGGGASWSPRRTEILFWYHVRRERSTAGNFTRRRYIWLILLASSPAPNPLSMFMTAIPGAQLLSIASRAASPLKLAP